MSSFDALQRVKQTIRDGEVQLDFARQHHGEITKQLIQQWTKGTHQLVFSDTSDFYLITRFLHQRLMHEPGVTIWYIATDDMTSPWCTQQVMYRVTNNFFTTKNKCDDPAYAYRRQRTTNGSSLVTAATLEAISAHLPYQPDIIVHVQERYCLSYIHPPSTITTHNPAPSKNEHRLHISIENPYTKRELKRELDPHLIPDLRNIVMEYV